MDKSLNLPGTVRLVSDVAAAFAQEIAARTPRSAALSGGSTAHRCYQALVDGHVPLESVDMFFSDERFVPLESPDSNEGAARRILGEQVEPDNWHSMRFADAEHPDDIQLQAEAYDKVISRTAPEVLHLGCGPDGHTASLFPGTAALDVVDRQVITNQDSLHEFDRLTFTFSAIRRCATVIVTIAGEEKRPVLKRIVSGENLPVNHISAPEILWLVDESAGRGILE